MVDLIHDEIFNLWRRIECEADGPRSRMLSLLRCPGRPASQERNCVGQAAEIARQRFRGNQRKRKLVKGCREFLRLLRRVHWPGWFLLRRAPLRAAGPAVCRRAWLR